jgi:SARP family transcriptional regulator, regulator of embCAB operon
MLRIYLTGQLCLTSPSGIVRAETLPRRQGRLAFAYLVRNRNRPTSRDELVDLLWPHEAPRAFDGALSALVSKLRAVLSKAGLGHNALTAADRCYQLHLPPNSWIDTEAAFEAVHTAESALRSGSHQTAYGPAVVACAILRRPFLPGDDGAWIDQTRQSLLAARLRALDSLAEIHSWNLEPALALRAAEESIALEPYRDAGYRRLMSIHRLAGNPAEAVRTYERLRLLLATELGMRPAAETQALLEAVTSPTRVTG